MRRRPSSGEAPRLVRFGGALGLALIVAATGSAGADAAETRAPAKAASPQQEPTARPDPKAGSEAQKRARRLFQDAEAHFQAGLFAEALGEYQAGYDAAPLPGFLINIAQCQRRLGNLTGALTTYRQFIMVAPDSPYVPQVRSLMADLEKLANDTERERARIAAAKPGTHGTDGDAARGSSDPREANGAIPLASGGAGATLTAKPPTASETPALVDQPRTLASSPGAQAETETAPRGSSTKWWTKSWLIGGAAALVAIAGGTAAVFALRSGDTTTVHDGTLGSLRR